MTTKSLLHSSLLDNQYYNSMLVGNEGYEPPLVPIDTYELIQTEILSTNTASVVFDLTSYSSSDYSMLQIRGNAGTTRPNANNDPLRIRYNADGGNNYIQSGLLWDQDYSTRPYGALGSSQVVSAMLVDGKTNTAFVVDIARPFDDDTFKHSKSRSGNMITFKHVSYDTAIWRNTDRINTITIESFTGNSMRANSRFSIYGLRGA